MQVFGQVSPPLQNIVIIAFNTQSDAEVARATTGGGGVFKLSRVESGTTELCITYRDSDRPVRVVPPTAPRMMLLECDATGAAMALSEHVEVIPDLQEVRSYYC